MENTESKPESGEPDFQRLAAELHDNIHEVAALVNYHSKVEIGWAPEEAIPLLAEALKSAFESGRKAGKGGRSGKSKGK